jgi:hypothetical protein
VLDWNDSTDRAGGSGRQLCQPHSEVENCVRQSGGAGSGGKPDKSGGNSQGVTSTSQFTTGTNGFVLPFVPSGRLIEDYRTARCQIARSHNRPPMNCIPFLF